MEKICIQPELDSLRREMKGMRAKWQINRKAGRIVSGMA